MDLFITSTVRFRCTWVWPVHRHNNNFFFHGFLRTCCLSKEVLTSRKLFVKRLLFSGEWYSNETLLQIPPPSVIYLSDTGRKDLVLVKNIDSLVWESVILHSQTSKRWPVPCLRLWYDVTSAVVDCSHSHSQKRYTHLFVYFCLFNE